MSNLHPIFQDILHGFAPNVVPPVRAAVAKTHCVNCGIETTYQQGRYCSNRCAEQEDSTHCEDEQDSQDFEEDRDER